MSKGVYGVLVGPEQPSHIVKAVELGGGTPVGPKKGAHGLVWLSGPEGLEELLRSEPDLRWVQLPSAGVEAFFRAGLVGGQVRPDLAWACAKGSYAKPVAEHALALALAGLRRLPERARASSWGPQAGDTLFGAPVTIVGGGGIAKELIGLLAPFGVELTVVRRNPVFMAGASRVLGQDQLHSSLDGALVVFLALALTPGTVGLISAPELALMGTGAWLVNVARGKHVVTADLVDALVERSIGGAALDVTDPEPLPDGHPLWGLANCLVTPHTADTKEMVAPLLAERVRENTALARQGVPLVGAIDPESGY